MEFKNISDYSPDDFREMLGLPSEAIEDRINAKMEECYAIVENRTERTLDRPQIKYDLKGHTAGWAKGTELIRLNIDILNDPKHQEDMIEQTLPHEVAHIIAHQLYGLRIQGHGREWKAVCYLLGIPARRCHSYETVPARVRSKPYRYECGCPDGHMVTNTIHTRIQKGKTYRCTKCGERLR